MPIQFPVVSVVTPSHNSSRFIRETIESVLLQKYPAIEHIVIDGGSTDGTLDILREYPHLTWISEPDRGQSDALNKGFLQAQGDIIGWLNADDTYEPDAVFTAVNFLLENDNVDLVYSDARVIDETSRQIGITKSRPFDLNLLLISNFINQPTVFVRRHIIKRLGGVNEDLDFVMDRELWLRIGCSFGMHYLPNKILANFRLIRGTKSFEQMTKFHEEWLLVLEQSFSLSLLSELPETAKQKALQKNRAQYHEAKMKDAIKTKDRRKLLQELCLALMQDKSLLLNRGIWLFVYKGLLGQQIDRERKYTQ